MRVGAVQNIAPNTEAEYTLDLKNVNGTRFLLQVYDYAMNKTTYVIDQTIGDPTALPDMIAYNLHQRFWVALNTTSTRKTWGQPTQKLRISSPLPPWWITLCLPLPLPTSCTSCRTAILTDATLIAWLSEPLNDMTYNEADGNIYGVISESVLVTVDKLTGKVTTVGKIGNEDFTTLTLACDGNGTFYCNEYDTPNVYKFTLDTMDAPEKVATVWDDTFTSFNASSMEVDPNTGI